MTYGPTPPRYLPPKTDRAEVLTRVDEMLGAIDEAIRGPVDQRRQSGPSQGRGRAGRPTGSRPSFLPWASRSADPGDGLATEVAEVTEIAAGELAAGADVRDEEPAVPA